jgi:hypothetical protein
MYSSLRKQKDNVRYTQFLLMFCFCFLVPPHESYDVIVSIYAVRKLFSGMHGLSVGKGSSGKCEMLCYFLFVCSLNYSLTG